MIHRTLTLASLLAVALSTSCYGNVDAPEEAVGAASNFNLDLTSLGDPPPATLPTIRLPRSAFEDTSTIPLLLRTDETFAPLSTLGTRVNQTSTTWHLETDAAIGQLFASRNQPSGPDVPLRGEQLQADSTTLLQGWGVPTEEIAQTVQRRMLAHDEEGGAVADGPRVVNHKTFFFRGIHGVRIEGHRAVVTWGRDGQLRRVYLRWPALAASGHRLRTNLSAQQIRSRAIRALRDAGENSGAARLHWKYVATPRPDGTVTLTLMAGARLASASEESREIDVDINAR